MRLLILGATGGVGRALLELALLRSHSVTAFVRTPAKVAARSPRLTVVGGDPLNSSELAAALAGQDALLSALGAPGRGPTTLHADGARSAVEAMNTAHVKRIIVVSTGLLFPNSGLVPKLLARYVFKNIVEDSREMERIIRASALDWTVARPPRLLNGAGAGSYRKDVDRLPPGGASIVRADVARFILDEVERREHVGQVVGIAKT